MDSATTPSITATILDTIRARHSVRQYTPQPITGEARSALLASINQARSASGLNIQFVEGNPEAFNVVANFGLVKGASSHIAFVARGAEADEAIGYWGQKIVLDAQAAGLNTCWVALCSRRKCKVTKAVNEKVRLVIAVGHGLDNGHDRPTKPATELATVKCANPPAWFDIALEAAQLAPTAMNNQHFHITLSEDARTVHIEVPAGKPGYNKFDALDLGIVKRNFQEAADALGADWQWA